MSKLNDMRLLIKVVSISLVAIGIMVFSAYMLSPGSYANAEVYTLAHPEAKVIAAIEIFKSKHPEYIVPKITIEGKDAGTLTDYRKDHWYHCYFYLKDERKILYAWTRPEGNDKTNFAFVSVNDGLELGNWKDINDLSRSENKRYKKLFEKNILTFIKKELSH